MKKLFSFLMTAVLCIGMTTAVMAAESEDTGNVKPEYSTIAAEATTVIDGEKVTLVSNALTVVYTGDEILDMWAENNSYIDRNKDKFEITILGQPADYTLPAGVTMPQGGIELTFTFTDVDGNPIILEEGKEYYIFHELNTEGSGELEVLLNEANADGTITVHVNRLCPFYVATLEEIDDNGGNGGNGGNNGNAGNNGNGGNTGNNGNTGAGVADATTSPKTSDAGYMVAMIAVVALAVVVFSARKVNANR